MREQAKCDREKTHWEWINEGATAMNNEGSVLQRSFWKKRKKKDMYNCPIKGLRSQNIDQPVPYLISWRSPLCVWNTGTSRLSFLWAGQPSVTSEKAQSRKAVKCRRLTWDLQQVNSEVSQYGTGHRQSLLPWLTSTSLATELPLFLHPSWCKFYPWPLSDACLSYC